MNERIRQLAEQAKAHADYYATIADISDQDAFAEKFAEMIVRECIGILEAEIELVKGYKFTACNNFDISWHEGKIRHFTMLVEKSKKHFGVEL